MALTKTVIDSGTTPSVGSSANFGGFSGGTLTWSNAYASGASQTSDFIDVTGCIGILITFAGNFTTGPTSAPKLEVYTSPYNDTDTLDSDAYETIEITYGASSIKQATLPIRFAEGISYIKFKVTNGTVGASDAKFYVAVTKVTL